MLLAHLDFVLVLILRISSVSFSKARSRWTLA